MGITNLILDTHILAWALSDPHQLSEQQHAALTDTSNTLWVSAVSAYEIANKVRLGKWGAMAPLVGNWHPHLNALGANELALTAADALTAGTMAWEHRDPFDRLLAAQTINNGYVLVTSDSAFNTLPGLVTIA